MTLKYRESYSEKTTPFQSVPAIGLTSTMLVVLSVRGCSSEPNGFEYAAHCLKLWLPLVSLAWIHHVLQLKHRGKVHVLIKIITV